MEYSLADSLAALPEDGSSTQIGDFAVRRETDFLVFSPPIIYQREAVGRLKVRASTFKHFGRYTLDILFQKLIPGINGKRYEEIPDRNPDNPPGAVLFSTTVAGPWVNFNVLLGREYGSDSQFRSHINRVSRDQLGPYLDWPHLAPLDEKQYLRKMGTQSEEL